MERKRSGRADGKGWLSPVGVSSIAALVTAVVGGLTLIFSGDGSDTDPPPKPQHSATAASGEPAPYVSKDIHGLAELTALVDDIAKRELPDAGSRDTFDALADDQDKVSAEVPARWHDQEVTNWLDGKDPVGIALIAAEDESRYFNTSNSPGVFLGVADRLPGDGTPEAYGERAKRALVQKCVEAAGGRLTGSSATGVYSIWTRCGGSDSMTVHYISKNSKGYATAADFQLVDRVDVAATDRVLRTMAIDPPVGIAGSQPADNDGLPGLDIP